MAIPEALKESLKKQFQDRILFDEPMARHTTLKVGGPADMYIMPMDEKELIQLIQQLNEYQVDYMVMGRGSNLLVSDAGVRLAVISLAKGFKTIQGVESHAGGVCVRAMAGARLAALCRYALCRNLAGMNFALGIPGSVGGAVLMNAGAAGGSMEQVVQRLKILSPDGEIYEVDRSAMTWGYRRLSIHGRHEGELKHFTVLSADFVLYPEDPAALRAQARHIVRQRSATQPHGVASAGCFFQNPETGGPAGKLIDLCGLKGFRIGDAQVSDIHANFIVNRGRATAREILKVADHVAKTVYETFSVRLQPEVKIIGDPGEGRSC